MVSDFSAKGKGDPEVRRFQSALRFAVVSDLGIGWGLPCRTFQSALRFAVVSDEEEMEDCRRLVKFQSALRFAVVSDNRLRVRSLERSGVSIRFEVRGGFRLVSCWPFGALERRFNPL